MGTMRRRAAVLLALAALAVGIALVASGMAGTDDRYDEMRQEPAEESFADDGPSMDWDRLPPSVAAWVRIPGTSVDYPVVLGRPDDPGFYLFHDAWGEWSPWGTPYVANGCERGLESPLVMVYGHHMSDGTMFADLADYSDEGFAADHGEIILITRERTIRLRPVLVNVIDADRKQVRLRFEDPAELDAYMESEAAESEVVLGDVPEGVQVYTFVTCSYQTDNSRTVVYAVEAG